MSETGRASDLLEVLARFQGVRWQCVCVFEVKAIKLEKKKQKQGKVVL